MLFWMFATLCAFFVKGLCGFANTLIFSGLMHFVTRSGLITPVELLLGFPTNIVLIVRERRHLNPRIYLPMMLLTMLGCIPGALLLKTAPPAGLKIVFGALIMGLSLNMLRPAHSSARPVSRAASWVIGMLSGLLSGLFGIGALMGAYMGRVTRDSHSFKANLCMVFLAENIFRVALYASLGLLTADVLRLALPLFPVMLLGLLLGMRAARLLPERRARQVVILMLFFSGAMLVVQTLMRG